MLSSSNSTLTNLLLKGTLKMYCSDCGREISDKAVACPNCGVAIQNSENYDANPSQQQAASLPQEHAYSSNSKKKTGYVAILLGSFKGLYLFCIAVAVLLIFMAVFSGISSVKSSYYQNALETAVQESDVIACKKIITDYEEMRKGEGEKRYRIGISGCIKSIIIDSSYSIDVNYEKDHGWTLLHIAADKGNADICKILIDAGAIVKSDDYGKTPLHVAAASGNVEVCKILIGGRLADVYAKDDKGKTPFDYAESVEIKDFLCNVAVKLLEAENHQGSKKTPLLLAITHANVDVVKYLVERGADISVTDEYGEAPLFDAVCSGNLGVVKYLVEEKGLNVNIKANDGTTPLFKAAAWSGKLEVVKYLVEKGADVNAKDNNGETPLFDAALFGKLDVVKYLVGKGADVNAKNNDGRTPIHFAAKNSNVDVVKFLVEKGADVNAKNNDGWTPILVAALNNSNVDVVKFLIEKGADVNTKNQYGTTPLYLATQEGHLEVVKYLLEKGADVNAKNNDGKTALDVAENEEIKEILRNAGK
jgi:ankyrin repeat protein